MSCEEEKECMKASKLISTLKKVDPDQEIHMMVGMGFAEIKYAFIVNREENGEPVQRIVLSEYNLNMEIEELHSV